MEFIWINCVLCSVYGVVLQIASLRVQAGDLGQEETVQKCLQNGAWVEGLFDRFGELINQVQQACRWKPLTCLVKKKKKVQLLKTRKCLQLKMWPRRMESLLQAQGVSDQLICLLKTVGRLWSKSSRSATVKHTLFITASKQKPGTSSTEDKDFVLGSILEDSHLVLLLVFVGFYS